jgi:ferredoxin
MPKKYHINTNAAPLKLDYVSKFKIVRGVNCINCGKCTKVCIYEAHKRRKDDPRIMAEPNTVVCRNCFRCIQECPRGALEKSLDIDYSNIGGAFWKPDNLLSLWKQAEDGSVPVSGAGYRGPFTGTGFDSMWTDMSEIVRPTRDGIHGREYINTAVELGRKLNHLTFNAQGRLVSQVPTTRSLAMPVLFDYPLENQSAVVKEALIKAAVELGTYVLMPAAEITKEISPYSKSVIPCLSFYEIDKYEAVLTTADLVSIDYSEPAMDDIPETINKVKQYNNALVIIRIPAGENIENIVSRLAHEGAEIIHIAADYRGLEINGGVSKERRHLKDIIRSVHLKLVDERIRDEVTIVASGGIAMAEYVPKAMLCGADLTAVDIPLLVALGVRVYEEPKKLLVFPEGLDKFPITVLSQRIVNLMGAWHSQMLEMMGAMGIREARRLRGESGRAIFFEEIDRDTFGKLFKKREKTSL